jgi:hypothetical protein
MTMTPLILIGYALVCIGAFLLGLRFVRAQQPPEGVTGDQARRFGRLLMMAATALLIFPVAAWLHGDLKLELTR